LACARRELAALRSQPRAPRVPFTVVVDCPYCDGAHVLEKLATMNVFACKLAKENLSFDPSLLKLVQVT
jgi:hypothetical protein